MEALRERERTQQRRWCSSGTRQLVADTRVRGICADVLMVGHCDAQRRPRGLGCCALQATEEMREKGKRNWVVEFVAIKEREERDGLWVFFAFWVADCGKKKNGEAGESGWRLREKERGERK